MIKYIAIIIVSFALGTAYYSSLDKDTYTIVVTNSSGSEIVSLDLSYTTEFCDNCIMHLSSIPVNKRQVLFFQNAGEGHYKINVAWAGTRELTTEGSFKQSSGAVKAIVTSDQINLQNLSAIGLIFAKHNN